MSLLWNARIVDRHGVRDRLAISIDGDRIVGLESSGGDVPPGAIDLAGKSLLPGLIDAHNHFMSDTERSPGFGPPPPQHGDAPRPRALGHYVLAAAARAIIGSGFTAIRDVGSYDDESLAAGQAISLGVITGPRIFSCGRIISATAPGGAIFGSMYREADGPWEMRKAVREQLRRGAHFIKFMATGARSVVLEDPEPPQMTAEEMAAIVDEAHRIGIRVAAHAEGLAGTRLALEAGADTIEHGLSLHREPELLDLMATNGTVLVPTLTTFHDLAERFVDDFPSILVEQAKRQLDEAYKTVAAAKAAGVTIAVGYDSGPPGTSAQEILRLADAGLSAIEAIGAATWGGAAALGREDLGSISNGALADLVIVDGEPDKDLSVLGDPQAITMVIKGGAVLT
ncbi:MAG TPA: amidohydrolase family protein [Acidimicrobiia bacterium]|nr:amidohydrolase family protein [Acidimicrobiia bacterium]